MALPLSTTTVTVTRRVRASGQDLTRATPAAPTTVCPAGTRAHIGQPSGRAPERAGQQETVDAVLHVDTTVELAQHDDVADAATGTAWRVIWARRRQGLGLDHVEAGIRRVTGVGG